MKLKDTFLQIFKTLLIIIVPLLFFQKCATEQDIYILHLKDGRELMGNTVIDTVNKVYVLRNSNRELFEIPFKDVVNRTRPEFVVKAPKRYYEGDERIDSPPNGVSVPCRSTSFYFLEGSIVGLKGQKIYIGAEAASGFRIHNVSIGLGFAGWSVREKLRFPVFLHVKYYPWQVCWRPFLLFNAGYIFDQYTSRYNVKPSAKIVNELSPKMIGGGIGIEIPVLEYMSITVDGGYRYLTVTNEIGVNTCDGIKNVLGYSEYHTGYFRIGVSF